MGDGRNLQDADHIGWSEKVRQLQIRIEALRAAVRLVAVQDQANLLKDSHHVGSLEATIFTAEQFVRWLEGR